jgi:hypothetical protein
VYISPCGRRLTNRPHSLKRNLLAERARSPIMRPSRLNRADCWRPTFMVPSPAPGRTAWVGVQQEQGTIPSPVAWPSSKTELQYTSRRKIPARPWRCSGDDECSCYLPPFVTRPALTSSGTGSGMSLGPQTKQPGVTPGSPSPALKTGHFGSGTLMGRSHSVCWKATPALSMG